MVEFSNTKHLFCVCVCGGVLWSLCCLSLLLQDDVRTSVKKSVPEPLTRFELSMPLCKIGTGCLSIRVCSMSLKARAARGLDMSRAAVLGFRVSEGLGRGRALPCP